MHDDHEHAQSSNPEQLHELESEHDPEWYPASRWFFDLLFRPRRFFSHVPQMHWPTLTVLCFTIVGISAAIGRLEQKMGQPNSQAANLLAQTWTSYWIFILLAGAMSALIYYALGGWWYGVRIGWSGGHATDKKLVRRVYVFAAMIHAVPTLVVTIAESLAYKTPDEAYVYADSLFYMLLLLFPFWAAIASYRGVRTVFAVQRIRGLIWFIVLPSIIYSLAIGVILLASIFSPPNVKAPVPYESTYFNLQFPRNWYPETSDPNFDPDHDIWFSTAYDNAVNVTVYTSEATPDEELAYTLSFYDETAMETWAPLTTWGGLVGTGRRGEALFDTDRLDVIVFVSQGPRDILTEWIVIADPETIDKDMPGFDLMTQTFSWTPAAQ